MEGPSGQALSPYTGPGATTEPKDSPNAEWRPDPLGRYEWRRFFLGKPTSLVKRGEVIGYDPIDELTLASTDERPEPQIPSATPAQGSDRAV